MKKLLMFKLPFKTNHFNLNQKVWIRRGSGALAAEVRGKFKGRGRYVTVWISWDRKDRIAPSVKEIQVSVEFYNKMRGDCMCDEWYVGLNTD